MKKIILVLFSLIFLTGNSCSPVFTNYLEKANISKDSKNLELYEKLSEDFSYNLIFKLENDLYIYGKKFLTVNDNSYEYFGNGYYKNGETVYFFNKEVTKISGKPKIKTYVKIETDNGLKGTSCEGQFHNYTYYLEIDKMKYKNDKREAGLLNSLIRIIQKFINI